MGREVLIFLPTLGKKKFFLIPILPPHLPHPLSLHPSLFPSPSLPILFSFTFHFPPLFPSPSSLLPFTFSSPSLLPFPFTFSLIASPSIFSLPLPSSPPLSFFPT